MNGTGPLVAYDPTCCEKAVADRGSQRSRQVVSPLRPVQAAPREAASRLSNFCCPDIPLAEEVLAAPREFVIALAARHEHTFVLEVIHQLHRQFAGEMVIAGARVSKDLIGAAWPILVGDGDHAQRLD